MKNVFLLSTLFLSLNVFSAERLYVINDYLCGEIDPTYIGDACVIELAKDHENFIVILDQDFVIEILGDTEELSHAGLFLDEEGLKRANKDESDIARGVFQKDLDVYNLDPEFVGFDI